MPWGRGLLHYKFVLTALGKLNFSKEISVNKFQYTVWWTYLNNEVIVRLSDLFFDVKAGAAICNLWGFRCHLLPFIWLYSTVLHAAGACPIPGSRATMEYVHIAQIIFMVSSLSSLSPQAETITASGLLQFYLAPKENLYDGNLNGNHWKSKLLWWLKHESLLTGFLDVLKKIFHKLQFFSIALTQFSNESYFFSLKTIRSDVWTISFLLTSDLNFLLISANCVCIGTCVQMSKCNCLKFAQ